MIIKLLATGTSSVILVLQEQEELPWQRQWGCSAASIPCLCAAWLVCARAGVCQGRSAHPQLTTHASLGTAAASTELLAEGVQPHHSTLQSQQVPVLPNHPSLDISAQSGAGNELQL